MKIENVCIWLRLQQLIHLFCNLYSKCNQEVSNMLSKYKAKLKNRSIVLCVQSSFKK